MVTIQYVNSECRLGERGREGGGLRDGARDGSTEGGTEREGEGRRRITGWSERWKHGGHIDIGLESQR